MLTVLHTLFWLLTCACFLHLEVACTESFSAKNNKQFVFTWWKYFRQEWLMSTFIVVVYTRNLSKYWYEDVAVYEQTLISHFVGTVLNHKNLEHQNCPIITLAKFFPDLSMLDNESCSPIHKEKTYLYKNFTNPVCRVADKKHFSKRTDQSHSSSFFM